MIYYEEATYRSSKHYWQGARILPTAGFKWSVVFSNGSHTCSVYKPIYLCTIRIMALGYDLRLLSWIRLPGRNLTSHPNKERRGVKSILTLS